MPKKVWRSLFVLAAGVCILFVIGHEWPTHAPKNGTAWTRMETPAPQFHAVPGMVGKVTESQPANLPGYWWVTFERADTVQVTELATRPFVIDMEVGIMEAVTSSKPVYVIVPAEDLH